MIKNFLTAICAAIILFATPAQAANSGVELSDVAAGEFNTPIEKIFAALPEAKGDYKSKLRPILLEGAMNTETEIFVSALKNPVAYRELNYLFVAGTYKDYPVVVVRTEIGMANAAASTALAIKKFNPVAVINQGTAGGHDSALKIGDIVIGANSFDYTAVKTDYSEPGAGFDVTKQKNIGTYAYDAATKKFQSYEKYPADPTLLNIAFKTANQHGEKFNVVSGNIGTGNAWLQGLDHIKFLHEKYGSSCEEMETNVAAQICHTSGVPFIGIRVLSDNVTISRKYIPETGDICQEFVLLVVENYIRDVLKSGVMN